LLGAAKVPLGKPSRSVYRSDMMRLDTFRSLLREMNDLSFAVLLRELAFASYNRAISRWAVLSDIADELVDEVTIAARQRITDTWIAEQFPGTRVPVSRKTKDRQ
jgi:hypothetical protein